MIMRRFILLFLLIVLVNANPIDQIFQQYKTRQRRNIDLTNWQSADTLFKQLYSTRSRPIEAGCRLKSSEVSSELRPVEGPMNIEQLPAMLAARNAKRYPYSRRDDPAVIGR